MPGLIERDAGDDDGYCQECQSRVAAGPCAACEAMICGDCGVMTRDPSGQRVICLSCARLIAGVNRAPKRRRAPSNVATAVIILAGIGAAIAAAIVAAN